MAELMAAASNRTHFHRSRLKRSRFSYTPVSTTLTDATYNFALRLKTLGGLTAYEYIAKIWTSEPDQFIVNPIHQMPGLNT